FKLHVFNTATLPYEEAFRYVGLQVTRTQLKEPFDAGLSVQFDNPRMPIIDNVRNDSPGENAGLQKGDEILSLAGGSATRQWQTTLAKYKTGQSVPISVRRNRRTIKTNLVLGEPERFEWKIEER